MLEQFVKRFEKLGYQEQTPIQKAVYQPMIEGENDIVALSPTGSGKTVAFTMPILANSMPGSGTQVIVIEPTQELAMQVANVIRDWAVAFKVKILPLIGGANVKRQQEQLKKHPEIVVGTPGRILSLINERKLKVSEVDTVVIDEADDLLNDTSLEQVKNIVASVPRDAQVAYFSATATDVLYHLKEKMGKDADIIDVRDVDKTRGKVTHGLFQISRAKRNEMLNRLSKMQGFKALVFFNQTETLNRAYNFFKHEGNSRVQKLTSGENKQSRKKALDDFRLGRIKLLLTTDVAARGLDIAKLPAVINYDLPSEKNVYIHRVGRTGRMGEPGLVINFGDDHDLRDLKHVLEDSEYDLKPIYYFNGEIVDHIDDSQLAHQKEIKQQSEIKKKQISAKSQLKPKKNKHRKRKQKNKGKPSNHKNHH
ncbi:DEAD/DEAH box helicase [Fructilactobacillus fructivorans]|uniref:ATP-dependent RNA helicase YfmL n=1 Tax=Fructilactobacillus fructivorans TaxID=1614 RepID=A0A0C1PKX8_9LACO|nr:DEAD/DEAH box helicase [Fructilactobacillus fructivorans]KID41347.1 ATP-dependent RNA helicase YfmL [Fructilactobacillus fructivorans]MCT0151767.1 DEAD/DEAH box helicase [Fructilactobacillus fructivorans]MCT2867105.1 DEAD/DEAH box helicase [Fructilactobacillus fructivorans]MCT2868335.1 DEAD/DEAH box helicase [Fructilactobacillus fructivorans]MCT2873043.1 DEAD/DEAH box helicase [Fructilactobacillus fructivorans]